MLQKNGSDTLFPEGYVFWTESSNLPKTETQIDQTGTETEQVVVQNSESEAETSLVKDEMLTCSCSYWHCDAERNVRWFKDQEGMTWTRVSSQSDLFRSGDGGERLALAEVIDGICNVQDRDGDTMMISYNGNFQILRHKETRQQKMLNLLRVFSKVDRNGDERLSLEELEQAARACSSEDQALIKSLQAHFSRIEWTRRGMFGQKAVGLSLREILDLTTTNDRSDDDVNELLLARIESIFDMADPERTRVVSREALKQVLAANRMPQRLKQAIETLIVRLDEVYSFHSSIESVFKPSRHDVRLMLCQLFAQQRNSRDEFALLELLAEQRKLYADESNPFQSIVPNALANNQHANQVFLSALAAKIVQDPDFVLRCVRRSDSDAFTVNFPGLKVPIRVIYPAQKTVCDYGCADQYGIWPIVLIEAYSRYLIHGSLAIADPSAPHRILELLTGSSNVRTTKDGSRQELMSLFDSLWSQNRLTVLSRVPGVGNAQPESILSHTCGVIGWEPQSAVMTLFNTFSMERESIHIDQLSNSFDLIIHQ